MINKDSIREKINSMDSDDFRAMIFEALDAAKVDYSIGGTLPIGNLILTEEDFLEVFVCESTARF